MWPLRTVFHIVLFQPEIPPNTGNVIRLSANTGCKLHLIEPLGFDVSEKSLRRAGLDYHQLTHMQVWPSIEACFAGLQPPRWFALSTRGAQRHDTVTYQPGDTFVFGPETRGLPQELLEQCPAQQRIRLPMVPGNRSLNLSNAVAVVVYEAWRQNGFVSGA
jgi:tRNA (cytidine/uridine-2'-O-)-methyltransferase